MEEDIRKTTEQLLNRLKEEESKPKNIYDFNTVVPNSILLPLKDLTEELIEKYKEQEKIIELMAKELAICGGFDYVEFGMSTGDFNKDIKNMIDYFKKKAKGE